MKFTTYTTPDQLEIIADWFDELAQWEDYEDDMAEQRLELTTIAGVECWVTPSTAKGLQRLVNYTYDDWGQLCDWDRDDD